jgi:hypothetical protein
METVILVALLVGGVVGLYDELVSRRRLAAGGRRRLLPATDAPIAAPIAAAMEG